MLTLPLRRLLLAPSGPSLDLSLLSATVDSRVTFSRASTATDLFYTNGNASSYNSYSTDVARVSATNGLLVEEARTNYFLNSTAPATQGISLTAGTYTCWNAGSSGNVTLIGSVSGLLGTVTFFNPVTFTLSQTETVTCSLTGTIRYVQLENGAHPTSFIVTAGASATRAIETARVSPISWFRPNAPGTLFVEFASLAYPYVAAQTIIAAIGKGSASGNDAFRLRITGSSNVCTAAALNGGTTVATGSTSTFTVGATNRLAAAYMQSGLVASLNGQAVVTESTAILGTGQTDLSIGTSDGGTTTRLNGYVRRVLYWPRALSASELRGITAP